VFKGVRTIGGLAALLLLLPTTVRANGAFPDTGQVLLPAASQTIVLGTNFGLILGEDGAHWRWTCEHGDGVNGYRYSLGADGKRLIGISARALVVSDDLGCTWHAVAQNEDTIPFDYFADTADANFVVALVESLQARQDHVERLDLRQPTGAPQILFSAPPDDELTTVEMARSDPHVIYATHNTGATSGHTRIARSGDGGQTWTEVDPQGAPDYPDLRLAAVDAADPQILYLRGSTANGAGEALVVSKDGGQTVRAAFTTPGALAAFLRLDNGDCLLEVAENLTSRLFHSTDGAATFTEIAGASLHVRSFAARGGVVYAPTDNVLDHMALAASHDHGATWQRVMGFGDVDSITSCGELPAVCLSSCQRNAAAGALPGTLCAASPDAGASAADAGPVDAAADAAAGDEGLPGSDASFYDLANDASCGCRIGARPRSSAAFVLLVLALVPLRRRRGGRGPCGTAALPAPRRTADRASPSRAPAPR
jgi:MYXO-CTERM domain-containing protein